MLKVLIADDHEIVRRGIIQILKEEFAFITTGEASNTDMLIEKAMAEKWDVIMSDIAMPGGGGIKALSVIKERFPFQKFLFISIYPEEQYAYRLISAGASGFVRKDAAPEELVRAVKTVLEGKRYLSPVLATRLSSREIPEERKLLHELLSAREFEVFLKLASGLTVSEIARHLSVSVNTVSTYRSRILEKMNLKNNADITRYVEENKLYNT